MVDEDMRLRGAMYILSATRAAGFLVHRVSPERGVGEDLTHPVAGYEFPVMPSSVGP
jgi:hypothetical protein